MKSSILVYLSLWSLGVAFVASQKVRGSNGIHRKSRRLQNRTTFESFFEIEYVANGEGDIDFSLVGQALAIAYNNLLEPRFSNEEDAEEYTLYDDPFNRRMEQVEVLSVQGLRRLGENEESRELQSSLRNLNVNLRVTGSCRGCSSRSRFTNQVSRRLLAMAKTQKLSKRRLEDDKGSGKGGSGPAPPVATPTGALTPVPPPVSPPPPTNPPTVAPLPATPAPVSPTPLPTAAATTPPPFDDPSTLPTEEELRAAYALEIQRWEFDIMNVTSLDEVDGPGAVTSNSTSSDTSTARASYCGQSVNQIYGCP